MKFEISSLTRFRTIYISVWTSSVCTGLRIFRRVRKRKKKKKKKTHRIFDTRNFYTVTYAMSNLFRIELLLLLLLGHCYLITWSVRVHRPAFTFIVRFVGMPNFRHFWSVHRTAVHISKKRSYESPYIFVQPILSNHSCEYRLLSSRSTGNERGMNISEWKR